MPIDDPRRGAIHLPLYLSTVGRPAKKGGMPLDLRPVRARLPSLKPHQALKVLNRGPVTKLSQPLGVKEIVRRRGVRRRGISFRW